MKLGILPVLFYYYLPLSETTRNHIPVASLRVKIFDSAPYLYTVVFPSTRWLAVAPPVEPMLGTIASVRHSDVT